ncbi:MAG: IclR family transcriptional regulator [Candidatus Adiutrix sp.]
MTHDNLNKSVLKALEVLELLDTHGALGITDIARLLSLDKSSVFRALNTLKYRHYVSQDPETLKYSNSYKLFEMGHNVVRETGLPKMAYRFMRRLAQASPGAVSLGVRDNLKAVYIDKIENEATVSVTMKIGQSLPLYCTAIGKALLAHLPEEQVCHLMNQVVFEKSAPNTLTTHEDLLADLRAIRQQGFSVDNEEHIPGLFCLAAPVFNARRQTIAAMGISTVKITLPPQATTESLAHEVIKAANAFTASIGGLRPNNLNL